MASLKGTLVVTVIWSRSTSIIASATLNVIDVSSIDALKAQGADT
jgi:hypothetical protein